MVYGSVFEKCVLGGGHGAQGRPAPVDPPRGPLKPSRNRFPELLAASGSFQDRLGAPGIDSNC